MTRAHLNNASDEAELLLLETIAAAEGHARTLHGLTDPLFTRLRRPAAAPCTAPSWSVPG